MQITLASKKASEMSMDVARNRIVQGPGVVGGGGVRIRERTLVPPHFL